MADAAVLGTAIARCAGSSPVLDTIMKDRMDQWHKGYQDYRIRSNWRELAIMETWNEYREMSSSRSADLVELILQNSEEYRGLSNDERLAAIKGFNTAIQWLGTNVGNCFLQKMLQAIGLETLEIVVEEKLTSSNENIRCQAVHMKQKIEEWRRKTGEDCE